MSIDLTIERWSTGAIYERICMDRGLSNKVGPPARRIDH